jgi:peptidoglycan hydrolase-like protein with peptidoglycan-binding domain
VRDLQQALKALGYDPGPIDGVFGDATEFGR